MKKLVEEAIESVNSGEVSFCRFITANDTGETGAHQEGFYIPKSSYSIFFDSPGERGNNKENFIKIKWQDGIGTESRAIYYGQGTRNEYRLTRFGKGFPFLTEEYTGALLVLTKVDKENYRGYVLNEDEDIENFLDNFGMSPVDTNSLIIKEAISQPPAIEELMEEFLSILPKEFPATKEIADSAREITNTTNNIKADEIIEQPDRILLGWLHTEFELFKKIESHYYKGQLTTPFKTVDEFIVMANSILNRRKSRAGKSLEHHLDAVFKSDSLKFSHPGKTEGKKKPDFIFPGNEEYHTPTFNEGKLIFLGSKTTCKDRWRQILNEANRIPVKHLFTLQQGISENQLQEMYDSKVVLVVPQPYIFTFPAKYREKIMNLKNFLEFAKEKQNN